MPQRLRTPTLLLQLAMLLQKAMMRRRPLQLELPTTMQRVAVKGARVGMCTSTLMVLCRTNFLLHSFFIILKNLTPLPLATRHRPGGASLISGAAGLRALAGSRTRAPLLAACTKTAQWPSPRSCSHARALA